MKITETQLRKMIKDALFELSGGARLGTTPQLGKEDSGDTKAAKTAETKADKAYKSSQDTTKKASAAYAKAKDGLTRAKSDLAALKGKEFVSLPNRRGPAPKYSSDSRERPAAGYGAFEANRDFTQATRNYDDSVRDEKTKKDTEAEYKATERTKKSDLESRKTKRETEERNDIKKRNTAAKRSAKAPKSTPTGGGRGGSARAGKKGGGKKGSGKGKGGKDNKDESLFIQGSRDLIGEAKMAKQPKLTKLLEGIFEEQPQVNKYEVVEGVRSYGIVGKQLYNSSNIMEIAKQLSHIAENAHTHIIGETDDWFDKVSVNKNMQSLKRSVAEFKKAATESHQLNQRLTGLYEDIGHVLNRYYEIDEADKGDMDNDGKNEPDSEEYLDAKRAAITKAVKSETVNNPDGLEPGTPAKDGEDSTNEALDTDKSPDGGGDEDDYAAKDGEAMKEAIRQTEKNLNKRPTRRLKDIGNVAGIPSLGQIARKFNK